MTFSFKIWPVWGRTPRSFQWHLLLEIIDHPNETIIVIIQRSPGPHTKPFHTDSKHLPSKIHIILYPIGDTVPALKIFFYTTENEELQISSNQNCALKFIAFIRSLLSYLQHMLVSA